MKNFVKGWCLAILGFFMLIVFFPLSCVASTAENGTPPGLMVLLAIALVFFLGGPILFWLILPLYNRLTRRGPGRT